MKFAPCEFQNWHIDGWDVMQIAHFDLIWGTFLSPLQRGNLGNLIVYPGSHHCVSQFLREKGARNSVWYDHRKGEQPQSPLPSLHSAGVADGLAYEVLAKEGDVILLHPLLAHGVGTNVTLEPRLAVYCRLKARGHAEKRRKMHKGGDLLGAGTWRGNIFSLQPGAAPSGMSGG
jgi:ectoine hydroxylase-related dioxygenase (phytanoyl-CoA dioxygenase family)